MFDDLFQMLQENVSRYISWQLSPGAEFRFFQICAQSVVFHDFPLCSLKSSSQDIMFKKKEHQKWLKISHVRGNQSFQVERYLFSGAFPHKISSLRQIFKILASK